MNKLREVIGQIRDREGNSRTKKTTTIKPKQPINTAGFADCKNTGGSKP